MQGLLSRNKIN